MQLLSTVVSFHVKEDQDISCTMGGKKEWLALHQVLAAKLCSTSIYMFGTTTTKLSILLKFWGCGYSYT